MGLVWLHWQSGDKLLVVIDIETVLLRQAGLLFSSLLSVQNKSTSTPTSPGPRTHSTPSIPVITPGQSGMYSPQYISYIPQIHMSPAVQVSRVDWYENGPTFCIGGRAYKTFRVFPVTIVSVGGAGQYYDNQHSPVSYRHRRCIPTLFPILYLDSKANTEEPKVSWLYIGRKGGVGDFEWNACLLRNVEESMGVTWFPRFSSSGSLPPQRSDQHQPTSAPPIMQAAAAAAGPPLVAATPYSSYISYNPQQFTGQPTMMQPMAHYPSQVGVM